MGFLGTVAKAATGGATGLGGLIGGALGDEKLGQQIGAFSAGGFGGLSQFNQQQQQQDFMQTLKDMQNRQFMGQPQGGGYQGYSLMGPQGR